MLALATALVSLVGVSGVAVPAAHDQSDQYGRACLASADKVVAWDAEADLYVVASYLERDRPPAAGAGIFPNLLELRRLSSGAQIGLVNCADKPGDLRAGDVAGPCDFRVMFGGRIPKGAQFRRQGRPLDRSRLAVKVFEQGADRGYALVSKPHGSASWHRVTWLGATAPAGGRTAQRLTVRMVDGEHWQGEVLVAIETIADAAGCKSTEVRMLRVREVDLDAPGAVEHQRHLLGRLKESSPFVDWRTAAEIAPLPPERLISAMVAAAEVGRSDFAARWWTESTAGLPLDRVAALAGFLRDRPELREATRLIKLPPE